MPILVSDPRATQPAKSAVMVSRRVAHRSLHIESKEGHPYPEDHFASRTQCSSRMRWFCTYGSVRARQVTTTATAKTHSGVAESMRAISVVRLCAVKADIQAINHTKGCWSVLRKKSERGFGRVIPLTASATVFVRNPLGAPPFSMASATSPPLLAKRWTALAIELKELDNILGPLTQHTPRLREQFGVGAKLAATLISVVGDNPERLKSNQRLPASRGVRPLPASSGKTVLHCLNRGGDESANNALWATTMVCMEVSTNPSVSGMQSH